MMLLRENATLCKDRWVMLVLIIPAMLCLLTPSLAVLMFHIHLGCMLIQSQDVRLTEYAMTEEMDHMEQASSVQTEHCLININSPVNIGTRLTVARPHLSTV